MDERKNNTVAQKTNKENMKKQRNAVIPISLHTFIILVIASTSTTIDKIIITNI